MTPGGKCFRCRLWTRRWDEQRDRYACRACWPQPSHDELLCDVQALFEAQAEPEKPPRPAGVTRQEWRRLDRLAGASEEFVHVSLPGLEHTLCGREFTPSLRRTTRDEDATCGICRMIAHSAKLAGWESPANPERDEVAP